MRTIQPITAITRSFTTMTSTFIPRVLLGLPGLLGLLGLGLMMMSNTGCASLTFSPNVKSVGEYKNMSVASEEAKEMTDTKAKEVKVLVGTIPEGMDLDHETLRVDPAKYELLGRVEANLNNPLAANMGLWVYDYARDERWRLGYCAWQVPLSWMTLTLWAWLSPTHYPCKATMGDDEARTANIVETLRRAGKALGADLVVVPAIGGTTVISGNQHSAVVSSVNATNANGFAVRTKSSPTTSPPTPLNPKPVALHR
jgi:hypothetical protein